MFWPSASSPRSVRAVGDHVLGATVVAALDDRALVDVGVLVGALVLDQVVDVDADLAGHRLRVVDADDDAVGVDVVDHATAAVHDHGARVGATRSTPVPTRAFSGRSVGTAWRACWRPISARLASSCSRKGHQRGGHRDDLRGATSMYWMRSATGGDSPRWRATPARSISAVLVERGVGLGDDVPPSSMADR